MILIVAPCCVAWSIGPSIYLLRHHRSRRRRLAQFFALLTPVRCSNWTECFGNCVCICICQTAFVFVKVYLYLSKCIFIFIVKFVFVFVKPGWYLGGGRLTFIALYLYLLNIGHKYGMLFTSIALLSSMVKINQSIGIPKLLLKSLKDGFALSVCGNQTDSE